METLKSLQNLMRKIQTETPKMYRWRRNSQCPIVRMLRVKSLWIKKTRREFQE